MEDMIKKRTEGFIKSIKEIFGERLISIMGYGSIADGSYIKGKSDINIVVIIERLTMEDIIPLKKKTVKHAIKNGIVPFFFSPYFMQSSSDTFAVEWREIKEHLIILYGSDIIKDTVIDKKDLRLQLEREIKQNYVDFQQGLIFNKDISSVLEDSYSSLKVFLRNIEEVCHEKIEKLEYMEELGKYYSRKIKITKTRLLEIAEEHLSFLNKLIVIIDNTVSKP